MKTKLILLAVVTGYSSNPAHGATLNTLGTPSVMIIYAEGGVTATDDFIITVDDPSLPMLSGDITISPAGPVTAGTPLTAYYSGSESVSYQWHRDGGNVGTGGTTFTPTDAGNYTVTVRAQGYNPKTSAPPVVVSLPMLSGSITISPAGPVITGTQLTANYTGGTESVSYQWHRDGINVGSGGTTYTPETAGSYTVTVSASGYAPKTSTPPVVVIALSSISLTGPTKTTYNSGEPLNLAGLVVTARYSNNTTAIVNNYTTYPASGTPITAATTVTVSYTEGGVTRTNNFAVYVSSGGSEVTIEMEFVSAGAFWMGRNGDGSSGNVGTPRQITLTQNFYIGKYEVTQKQWQDVMGSVPTNIAQGDNLPVGGISWYDAVVFCNRLSMIKSLTPAYSISGSTDPDNWGNIPTSQNATWDAATRNANANGYQLPTSAQWEYAAKGGHSASNPYKIYSGSDTVGDVAWYNGNTNYEPKAVGTKAANELGIHDMSGNVREWCWNWLDLYGTDTNTTDPVGPPSAGSYPNRIIRGGRYSSSASDCRSAYAENAELRAGNAYDGLRVVRIAE